jgi:2'-hydroxyisoflavone reductase
MNLLILGGTSFVGRHIVECALARGHDITLFHRGQTGPKLFPGVEKVLGDRTTSDGLNVPAGRSWDAVIDTSGYFPKDVRASARLLESSARRYLFMSSTAAYADFSKEGMDESGRLRVTGNANATELTNETYGPLKVLCEQAVQDAFGARATVVRPGVIVGPHDPTGRFTYWPDRIARGGEVLAPGSPWRKVQFIDGRDLARFVIGAVESDIGGVFNARGPAAPLDMRTFLETCRRVVGGDATFTWVSDSFLEQAEIVPQRGLPLWIPESADMLGSGSVDSRRAIAAGLTFTPLEQTISDTFEWDRGQKTRATGDAISADKEALILADWHRLTQAYRV